MNSYITRSLEEGESIVLQGHYHWSFTACQVIWTYVLGVLSVVAAVATHFWPEHKTVLIYVALACLVVAVGMALWGYILRSRTEFAVTDSRFVQKDGILNISLKEIPLYKVETVNFSQSLLQRILGTGDIELVGSGGTTHRLTYIAHPMEVKKAIARAIGNKERKQDNTQLSSTFDAEAEQDAEGDA